MLRFDEDALRVKLRSMRDWQIIAFILLCCERMLPNFDRFSKETQFGDILILRKVVDAAWTYLGSGRYPSNLEYLIDSVKLQAPNTELFSSRLSSSALDAANATEVLLLSLESPNVESAVEVACLSRDTVDMFVQIERSLDPNSAALEDEINFDTLMQQELVRQSEDIDQIKKLTDRSYQAVTILRQVAKRYAAGSLAIFKV